MAGARRGDYMSLFNMAGFVVVEKRDYDRKTGKLTEKTLKIFPEAFGAEVVRLYNEREELAAQAVKVGKPTSPSHLDNQRTKATIVLALDFSENLSAKGVVESINEEIEKMKS